MQLKLVGNREGFGIVEIEGDKPQPGEVETLDHGTLTYDQIRALTNGEPYPMSLVGEEAEWVAEMLRHGIDSCLEACYVPARGDSYSWEGQRRLNCVVSPLSLPVLLRRLMELDENGAGTWPDSGECPGLLVEAIIDTLEREDER